MTNHHHEMLKKINGFGRYPTTYAHVISPRTFSECRALCDSKSFITRGLGRSYGDSSLAAAVLQSNYLDHFISFDTQNGTLTVEAGVSLREILKIIIPKGWFLPVTPGTSEITIGGAIASDVHGKNHHVSGTFTAFVQSAELMLASGEIVTISKTIHPDLFQATCGGMGLTGIILSATIQLIKIESTNIKQTTIKTNHLAELCELLESHANQTYSVAWLDTISTGKKQGRALLMLGEHEKDNELISPSFKQCNVPTNMPAIFLNKILGRTFNALYYHRMRFKTSQTVVPIFNYFYPLDKLSNWNRLYGKPGFTQYQFVIPKTIGYTGIKNILDCIAKSNQTPFLSVLKLFGPQNNNILSFPMHGFTLALDFKMTFDLPMLLQRLDELVIEMGGRIYLAKDATLSEESFKKMYPAWQYFEAVREKYGANKKFQSDQSIRLGLA